MESNATPSKSVLLHLRIEVSAEREGDFAQFLREARKLYEAPGGIRIKLLRDLKHPTRYIELVEYDDRSTYDEDQVRVETDPVLISTLERWRALLASRPEVEAYEDVTHLLEPREQA